MRRCCFIRTTLLMTFRQKPKALLAESLGITIPSTPEEFQVVLQLLKDLSACLSCSICQSTWPVKLHLLRYLERFLRFLRPRPEASTFTWEIISTPPGQ